ncbi:hypothetical protein GHT06_013850 [Daphnia sinensis]|uniref:Alpha 1,4-glycosyltransferase domain-containing protein n=1 Tax=Daphnia sinensis TaxID=1820382 RepID=A0AAD5PVP0_9CRUS|nr:hypothetical protein GHT06_013850 [Daphnia sinensis]
MKSKDVVIGHPKPGWRFNSWKRIWLKRRANINLGRAFLLIFGSAGLVNFVYNALIAPPIPLCFVPDDLTRHCRSDPPRKFKHNYDFSTEGDKAFYLETAGSETLSIRQACAVESLALHNPNLTAYVLFSQERVNSSSITLKTLTENYKNIRIVGLNMDNYLAGSPLEHWYKFTDWRKGRYHVAHFSDGLRLHTLSKYGGYYFDLDIIHVRPVTYYRNFLATENGHVAADAWTHNGPGLLTKVVTKWCGVNIHFRKWQEFFKQRGTNETINPDWLTSEVIGFHVWNMLAKREPVFRNSTQYFTQLARSHCPAIFSIAPDIF